MRPLLIALLLTACGTPDRWNAGVSRGNGTATSNKLDFDTDETRLELGVSGPLFDHPEPRRREPPPCPVVEPEKSAPAPQPATVTTKPQGRDMSDLIGAALIFLSGVAGGEGARRGHRTWKARRASR